MKKILLVSDLHLDITSKNEYRWDIFDQIEEKVEDHKLDAVYILGDLTDKKDTHDSNFTNKLNDCIQMLSQNVLQLIVLAGNHDYVDQNIPFFKFLNDTNPKINYIYGNAKERNSLGVKELFLPHVKNPEEMYDNINFNEFDVCFTHLDVKGTKLDNGMKSLQGLSLSFFKGILTVSGHIHVGQQVGKNFHYIGSPYSIIYERENILHRGLIITYGNNKNISLEDTYFNFPRKIAKKITKKEDIKNINNKDLYKFDIELSKSELDKFSNIKKDITQDNIKINLKLKSENNTVEKVNKSDYFKSYCKNNDLSKKLIKTGKELMS